MKEIGDCNDLGLMPRCRSCNGDPNYHYSTCAILWYRASIEYVERNDNVKDFLIRGVIDYKYRVFECGRVIDMYYPQYRGMLDKLLVLK